MNKDAFHHSRSPSEQKNLVHIGKNILHRYYKDLKNSVHPNGLVPEFFGRSHRHKNPRLLCQTRSIVFLEQYADLFGCSEARSLSDRIFAAVPLHYRLTDQSFRSRFEREGEADLYSVSFWIFASSLYFSNRPSLSNDIQSFKQTTDRLTEAHQEEAALLKKVTRDGCTNQNAIMHYFESLLSYYSLTQSRESLEHIKSIHKTIFDKFYCPIDKAIGEEVDSDGRILSYVPGHSYEWYSLLHEAKILNIVFEEKMALDPIELDRKYLNNEGIVYDSVPAELGDNDEDSFRIWPNLERLRALLLIGFDTIEEHINKIFSLYFDDQLRPKEYLAPKMVEGIKSTTGYHIIGMLYPYIRSRQNVKTAPNGNL